MSDNEKTSAFIQVDKGKHRAAFLAWIDLSNSLQAFAENKSREYIEDYPDDIYLAAAITLCLEIPCANGRISRERIRDILAASSANFNDPIEGPKRETTT